MTIKVTYFRDRAGCQAEGFAEPALTVHVNGPNSDRRLAVTHFCSIEC
jgi:hypothetical protein